MTTSILRTPLHVVLGLAMAIAPDTGVQLLWATIVMHVRESSPLLQTAWATATQPLFLIVILMFIAQFFNWMYVLARADLSYAKPITSLSFVTVAISAHFTLGQTITFLQSLGIMLILLGVWFVSQTNHVAGPTRYDTP